MLDNQPNMVNNQAQTAAKLISSATKNNRKTIRFSQVNNQHNIENKIPKRNTHIPVKF
jgi:hypothetical protein